MTRLIIAEGHEGHEENISWLTCENSEQYARFIHLKSTQDSHEYLTLLRVDAYAVFRFYFRIILGVTRSENFIAQLVEQQSKNPKIRARIVLKSTSLVDTSRVG